jgi:hemoglobin/transferrin/lactoferrin receptor protein
MPSFRLLLTAVGFVVFVSGAVIQADASELTGAVKDTSGGALVGARVLVLTPQRAVVGTTSTDQSGKYAFPSLPDGPYLVIVQYPALAEKQLTITVGGGKPATLDVVLEVSSTVQTVTVTASPGALGDLGKATQPINTISAEDILERAKTVVAQAVEGETAVNLQRTSPGMAGIFVRGLTGNKVNIFVDGVRYSNGAQRGGVNTFLDMIDPTTLEGIEVLRGTSSAQYGSDALGGSIQFLTHPTPLSSTGQPKLSGSVTTGGETGHHGGLGAVSLAYSRSHFGLSGSFAGRKTGDYRPGEGEDSHSATLRFLGLPTSTFLDSRMPDTGFHQFGTQLRANWLATPNLLVVGNYVSSRQDGANRWDQILGGDGNLISELNDLQLDLFYVRVESLSAGFFDRASATYSFNTQREERVNQGGQGNPNATIGHEPERTTVNGLQFNASKQLSPKQSLLVGGDMYFEGLTSEAFDVNPVTGVVSPRRPRVPDGANYKQGGFFGQLSFEAKPDLLVLTGAARVGYNAYSARASDAPIVNGRPLWPDDSLDTASATFRAGAALTPTPEFTIITAISTGYRAPHMTDLGTLGLTGSGFEVAAPDVEGLGGTVGSTADSSAVSTGQPVEQVTSEKSINFDVGARYRVRKARVEAGFFVNHIDGNIQKQSLILPQGAVGTTLGGQPITSQNPNGVVFVSLSTTPVLVRANFDKARIWGFEWLGEVNARPDLTIGSTFTYLRAIDTTTDLPPNIEGGTPAPGGTIWARYMRTGSSWWVQPYLVFAAEQTHLSTLDLGDRRTAAPRSRTNIQNFFRNGARARGWVNAGADGIVNNADDILIATGETLAQVQDRVLGPGVNSAPLYTAVESYAAFGIRFGLRMGPHTIFVDAENLTDTNYRGISWGMDAPGRGLAVRYVGRF